jgi:subtilisin-like proprotein convertase family protein
MRCQALRWAKLPAVLVALWLWASSTVAIAAVPTGLPVQVAVASAGGGPVTDGTYAASFTLYDKEAGGAAVWTEGLQALTLKSGLGATVLGLKQVLEPKLLATPLWLEVKIEPDPALSRVPLRSVAYALRAAAAEALDCSGCVGTSQLDPAVLQPYAKTADLQAFAKTSELQPYAKTADLQPYAKTADLAGLAKTADLTAYAKLSGLANVALSGQYGDLQGVPDLTGFAKTAALANVATTGKYADLAGLPALPQLGKSCGTGLAVQGLAADGSLQCTAVQTGTTLPPDGLSKVSNGALSNVFTDTFASAAPVEIPDNNPVGASNAIVVPDLGTVQALTVTLDIANSDVSSLVVTLFDPNNAAYVLWDKSGKGNTLQTSFPPSLPTSGDLSSWVGKNPKGKWQLSVVDGGFLNNAKDGQIKSWSIQVKTVSASKVQAGTLQADALIAKTLQVSGGTTLGGGLQLGNEAAACTDQNAGTLRWTGQALQLCAQKVWNNIAVVTGVQAIPGLKVWVAADSGLTMNGATVAQWADQSGNGNHFVQGNAGRQPKVVANGISGKPTLQFTASAQQTLILGTNFPAPVSVFYVAKMTGGSKQRILSGVNNNWLLGWWDGGEDQGYFEGWVTATGSPSASNNAYLYGVVQTGSASSVYRNGKLLVSNGNGTTGPNGLSVVGHNGASEFSDAQVSEILVYAGALSDQQRQSVETYLNGKYSIY